MYLYELWKLWALQVVVLPFLFFQTSCNSRPVRLIAAVWNPHIFHKSEQRGRRMRRHAIWPVYILARVVIISRTSPVLMLLYISNGSGTSCILVCSKFLYLFNPLTPFVAHKVLHCLHITCVSTMSNTVHIVWRIQSQDASFGSIMWNPFRHIFCGIQHDVLYVLYLEKLEPWLEFKMGLYRFNKAWPCNAALSDGLER